LIGRDNGGNTAWDPNDVLVVFDGMAVALSECIFTGCFVEGIDTRVFFIPKIS